MNAPGAAQGRAGRPRNTAYRRDTLWSAAFVHRMSGIALAVFLPFHFAVLGMALRGAPALDGFLAWTQQPLVKLAEALLVFCLAVHLLGGLRIMMIEARGWRPGQRRLVMASVGLAAVAGTAFLIGA